MLIASGDDPATQRYKEVTMVDVSCNAGAAYKSGDSPPLIGWGRRPRNSENGWDTPFIPIP